MKQGVPRAFTRAARLVLILTARGVFGSGNLDLNWVCKRRIAVNADDFELIRIGFAAPDIRVPHGIFVAEYFAGALGYNRIRIELLPFVFADALPNVKAKNLRFAPCLPTHENGFGFGDFDGKG